MKNLKKILIAVAVFALIVSAVTIAAIADSETVKYTGKLDRATTYYQAVEDAMNTPMTSFDKKVAAMTAFYNYVTGTPVSPTNPDNPEDAEYAANYERIMTGYDPYVVDLFEATLTLATEKTDPAMKSESLELVYSFMSKVSLLNPENAEYAALVTATYDESLNIANAFLNAVEVDSLASVVESFKTNHLPTILENGTPDDMGEAISAYDAAYPSYALTTKALHMHLVNCPIDAALLTDATAYDAFVEKITAVETVEIEALAMAYAMIQGRTDVDIPYLRYHNAADSLNAYINLCVMNYNSNPDLSNYVRLVRDDIEERTAKQKYETDYNADVREYEYSDGALAPVTFEDKMPWTFSHGDLATGKNTGTHYELWKENGDQHLALIYGSVADSGTQPTSGYFEVPIADSTAGYVVEFDFGVPADLPASEIYCNFTATEDGISSGQRVSTVFFKIVANDLRDTKGNTILKNVVTPGEWTHFTLAYNPEGPTCMVYVDYMPVAETFWDCPSATDTYKWTRLRINGGRVNMTVFFDDIFGYRGTSYRDSSKFSNMTEADKFAFYVSYASDDKKQPMSRSYAYTQAQASIDMFRNDPAMSEYVSMFDKFDYQNDVLLPARTANIAKYTQLVAELTKEAVTTTNIALMTAGVKKANDFVESCGQFIDQASEEFVGLKAQVVAVNAEVKRVSNVKLFVQALERFKRATTYASMVKHAASADMYYEICEFENLANYELAKTDPVVSSFEKKIGNITIIDYYKSFKDTIVVRAKYENSIRIIDCVNFIENGNYGDGVSYEPTEEFWEKNFQYINKYVLIIRDIVNNDYYDVTYPNVDVAVDFFKVIDDSFYELLQKDQVATMNTQLENYLKTDSYIEKLGICTYLRNYIDVNDVDLDRDDVKEILFLLEVYENEVAVHKDEYANLLDQNTTYFINTMNKMDAFVDYASLLSVYEEASTYYYGMNVDSEEAKIAIAKYVECEEILKQKILDNAMFAGFVSVASNSAKMEEKYIALVYANLYLSCVDTSMEMMDITLATYNNMVSQYNSEISEVNAEITAVNSLVCAVRTINIPAPVLAIIKKIFE